MKSTFRLYYIVLFYTLLIVSASCNDDEINSTETGTLTIEFDNHFGKEDLELNSDYINASGEQLRISKLNYYISNIKLRTVSGTEFTIPQDSSYFLISESDEASQAITIKNIPAGNYNEISFTIGVDSARSTMDVSKRTGALDPAQGHDGMYWEWNSGYIFFKMEGTSPVIGGNPDHKFYYHIGGFGGFDSPTINNIRETTVEMGSAYAEIRANKKPQVHLHVDVSKVFEGGSGDQIKLAEHPLVMFSEFSRTVSARYMTMFEFDHVHN